MTRPKVSLPNSPNGEWQAMVWLKCTLSLAHSRKMVSSDWLPANQSENRLSLRVTRWENRQVSLF
jgi:hypothetical protein